MKGIRIFATVIFIFLFISVQAQQQIFRSNQSFSASQLTDFYSSFIIEKGRIYFIATDYKLYAYDKESGKELWDHSLGYKTKRPCFVSGDDVYAPYYSDGHSYTARLAATTGKFLTLLTVGPLQTKPIVKNNILYGTAIIDGGTVFAYDIKADSLLWSRFVAHGVSNQPYYFPGYIQANAEANHWFRLNYNGELMDTTCKEKRDIWVRDIPCSKDFLSLTHDGAELTSKFSMNTFGEEEAITPDNTLLGRQHSFVLHENKLAIITKKGKLQKLIDLPVLLEGHDPEEETGLTQLIDTDEETVSLIWLDLFIRYNFKTHKLEKQIDLSAWEPSQVTPDGNNIWLISRKDGLLYGLAF